MRDNPNGVEVNWLGNHTGVVWYKVNGRRYSFGDQDGHRTLKVLPTDATALRKKYPGIFD